MIDLREVSPVVDEAEIAAAMERAGVGGKRARRSKWTSKGGRKRLAEKLREARGAAGVELGGKGGDARDGYDLLRLIGWAIARREGMVFGAEGIDGEKEDPLRRRSADTSPVGNGGGSISHDVGERGAYQRHRERVAEAQRRMSRSARDIGPLPKVTKEGRLRRDKCARDFRLFCETYFPEVFCLGWSDDHLTVIAAIERAVLEGGQLAIAMPRGSGKTSLCEVACIWAILYGHRAFVVLIAADEDGAVKMLASIRAEFENNDRLLADFPEVCAPIRSLEGINQRAAGQTCDGVPTRVVVREKFLVLPFVEGSAASSAVIRVSGITGSVRGMKHKRGDGSVSRPDLVLVDDPQTDDSARSVTQCATRESLVNGAVLGLAGPGERISVLATVTVIQPDDMADRMLDRKRNPQWRGVRTKMVNKFPSEEKLWAEYADLRRRLREADEDDVGPCNAFYRKNRAAMDAGADVPWEARKEKDDISALQHAMNLRIDKGDAAFFAEYQNEPLKPEAAGGDELRPEHIMARVNRHARGEVPQWATRVTAFIDVQGEALFYAVLASADDFTCSVMAYGAEPEQGQEYWALREVKHGLRWALKHGNTPHPVAAQPPSPPRGEGAGATALGGGHGGGLEAAIYAGLDRLCGRLLGREWRKGDGTAMRIELCVIDGNWGESTETVYKFCRESAHAKYGGGGVLMPSHGIGIGAARNPMITWPKRSGERVGLNWRIPPKSRHRPVRHITYDTNWWKSFVASRLSTAPGDVGAMTVFGDEPRVHRMLADHLTAERGVLVSAKGRQVSEWVLKQVGRDNHWLDCVVGACVAASIRGAALPSVSSPVEKKRKLRPSEIQARKRAQRMGGSV